MIALNLKRYRMLERHAQQNFVLSSWSNDHLNDHFQRYIVLFKVTMLRHISNKLLVDDAKKVCRGQRVEETASQMKFYTPRYGEKDYKSEPLPWTRAYTLRFSALGLVCFPLGDRYRSDSPCHVLSTRSTREMKFSAFVRNFLRLEDCDDWKPRRRAENQWCKSIISTCSIIAKASSH